MQGIEAIYVSKESTTFMYLPKYQHSYNSSPDGNKISRHGALLYGFRIFKCLSLRKISQKSKSKKVQIQAKVDTLNRIDLDWSSAMTV